MTVNQHYNRNQRFIYEKRGPIKGMSTHLWTQQSTTAGVLTKTKKMKCTYAGNFPKKT